MSYKEVLDYLYFQLPMFQRQGPVAFKKDLKNIRALLRELGNPHKEFKSIHIAGTNGKGSCSHILASLLAHEGRKIGLYTSPHYKDFRERIKINGNFIPKKDVIRFVIDNRSLFDEINPSFFEITVVMAFHHFADSDVDYAVIETGLGGRLDSTNVLDPILSLITNIGFDHQEFLGNTLPAIAKEKAGIIKRGRQVIIGERQAEVQGVFEKKAKQKDAPINYAADVVDLSEYSWNMKGSNFALRSGREKWNLKSDLAGSYQEKNLRAALAAYKLLAKAESMPFEQKKIVSSLRQIRNRTKFFGRFQVLRQKDPMVLCDSAHNLAGIKNLLDSLDQISRGSLHIVFGTVKDKDIAPLLELLPKDAQYYFVKADIPRGMPQHKLQKIAEPFGLNGKSYSSVRRGFASAIRRAEAKDLVLVCGSIFVVAEVL
ncbi:MAG: bifunctional folylpolyglutamate synthase/dihydrofolate synthase [Saprospiraceae bacterium]|nr:bifunctional folylpolyglutamate synthase/dihydrofolate synthase [Saprospiraceae bacterium]